MILGNSEHFEKQQKNILKNENKKHFTEIVLRLFLLVCD